MQRSQNGVYIYVVDEQTKTAQSRAVSVAQIQDGVAVVSTGLQPTDRVVVDGQYKLKPGSKVQEVARSASGAASASRSGSAANPDASGAGK